MLDFRADQRRSVHQARQHWRLLAAGQRIR
jgi:hypothetical protein